MRPLNFNLGVGCRCCVHHHFSGSMFLAGSVSFWNLNPHKNPLNFTLCGGPLCPPPLDAFQNDAPWALQICFVVPRCRRPCVESAVPFLRCQCLAIGPAACCQSGAWKLIAPSRFQHGCGISLLPAFPFLRVHVSGWVCGSLKFKPTQEPSQFHPLRGAEDPVLNPLSHFSGANVWSLDPWLAANQGPGNRLRPLNFNMCVGSRCCLHLHFSGSVLLAGSVAFWNF